MELRKKTSKFLLTDSIIIITIVAVTYLLFVFEFFPDQKEISILGYKYNSGYFQSVKVTAFMAFSKLVPLVLLCIWFVTNKSWWYHVLIIPMSIYVFQLLSVINDDVQVLDVVEFYQSLAVSIPLMLLLYATRRKLNFYIKAFDLKAQIDQQIIEAEKELE